MKDKRKYHNVKLETKSSIPSNGTCFGFSQMRKLCQNQIMNSQNNLWLILYLKDTPLVMKTKYPVHIMTFGVVTSD